MKIHGACAIGVVALSLVAGCTMMTEGQKVESGPAGTIAYSVEVEASDPGVRIEANNEDVGKAPLKLKIFGDRDGTFHNFGSGEYIIRAYPLNTNQHVQTKVFRTGGWFSQEDLIPKKIYFDMNQQSFSIGVPPRY